MRRTRARPPKKHARIGAATLAALLLSARATAQSATGLQEGVVFGEYSPLTSEAQVVHRLLSPLAAAQIERTLQESHQQLREQSIDLARKHSRSTCRAQRRRTPMRSWCSSRPGRTRACRLAGRRCSIAMG